MLDPCLCESDIEVIRRVVCLDDLPQPRGPLVNRMASRSIASAGGVEGGSMGVWVEQKLAVVDVCS